MRTVNVKRITSFILTLAMVLSMGLFSFTFAASSSKTISDIEISNVTSQGKEMTSSKVEIPVYNVTTGATIKWLAEQKVYLLSDTSKKVPGMDFTKGGLKSDKATVTKDSTIVLEKEGDYTLTGEGTGKEIAIIRIAAEKEATPTTTPPAVTPPAVTPPAVTPPAVTPPVADKTPVAAKASSQKITVDGKETAFQVYNIGGNNYLKLRDVAMVLNGTPKQFEVGFDKATSAITLKSATAYTVVGGEMKIAATGDKTGTPTASTISLDGKALSFTAYNIENNNYFKLRDLGKALNFGVTYDDATKTAGIASTTGFTE